MKNLSKKIFLLVSALMLLLPALTTNIKQDQKSSFDNRRLLEFPAPDEDNCFFFENGWEERLTAAVRPAFEEYIKRCPPKKREGAGKKETEITPDNCP